MIARYYKNLLWLLRNTELLRNSILENKRILSDIRYAHERLRKLEDSTPVQIPITPVE